MTNNDNYEILAIKYGGKSDRTRRESFLMDDAHDLPHPLDYFIWVIRNSERTILVDTGFDRTEAENRGRAIDREPPEALRLIGVDAGELEDVIVTHLHFDHAGTLGDYPKARFHLQEAEMAFATGPCMCHDALKMPFTADHVCQMVQHVYAGRVSYHNGDSEIAPGISVHKTGGHSRGLQCVRVNTARGPVVLASDASHFYENFEQGKIFPIVVDAEDTLRGYARLKELAGGKISHVVPGHDPLVLERYPALNSETTGIVVRLDADPK